jgi:ATP10 protein
MKFKIKMLIISTLLAIFFSSGFGQSTSKIANESERSSLLNSAFPELKAKTLEGKEITFPADTKDKATIICVAFKDETQAMADGWTKDIMANYNDSTIHYFEVPMLKNGLKMMRKMIDGGMRKKIDGGLHDNVATYYGDLSAYKKSLLMPDENTCYIFLIDKSGNIQFTTSGNASAEQLQLLYSKLKEVNNK